MKKWSLRFFNSSKIRYQKEKLNESLQKPYIFYSFTLRRPLISICLPYIGKTVY
ncbi:hypothetical protein J5U23_01623 [Saccharolobus shibatae B12]|uniref:Uncharacterized protein n=1 Tax=Saccharolobus shibatae (strain ATCC 51178 / DSM 5389 / JCM 8931 / NBRC 15437 / B12) TaxID=523848 RepID=A0A8F5GTA7_SACSH|nr:hypothetical protein J5U23_01623 [Saccharolobus shibatae B12]